MQDARFEDGDTAAPLNILALDPKDLQVVSALVQDAVFPVKDMKWIGAAHEFAVLLNRFRWEAQAAAEQRGRSFERVQSVLIIYNVLRVASQELDRSDKDLVLSLMSISFETTDNVGGFLTLTLAGDAAIRVEVEALELRLKDVTRPYRAPSGKVPRHDI